MDDALQVVKVGGSLFEFPLLSERLRGWLRREDANVQLLIPGGGALADWMRLASGRFAMRDETVHWLCIDTLRVMARFLCALLPDAELIEDLRQLEESGEGVFVFDPGDWLREIEQTQDSSVLPHNWEVTGDSISARLATLLGAQQLVLLKSILPTVTTRQEASENGYLDKYFPEAAPSWLPVRCVDLRELDYPERMLK